MGQNDTERNGADTSAGEGSGVNIDAVCQQYNTGDLSPVLAQDRYACQLTVHVLLVTSDPESPTKSTSAPTGGGDRERGRAGRRNFWSLEGCVCRPFPAGTERALGTPSDVASLALPVSELKTAETASSVNLLPEGRW